MPKQQVLFVCIHNSARSQMAEELLRKLAGDRFEVESAGLDTGQINPIVAQVLNEDGIDITTKKTQAVAELLKANKQYDYVVTVCDEASAERCPVFPGKHQRLHWPFADPSQFVGSHDDKLKQVRTIRDQIRKKISQWLS